MAKINIQAGIISSSANYGLYHTATKVAQIETDGFRVYGDLIVSSSVTHMTQSFSSGSTIFGDTQDDTHLFTGSLKITGSSEIDGKLAIGTSSPDTILHLDGGTNTYLTLEKDDAGTAGIYFDNAGTVKGKSTTFFI